MSLSLAPGYGQILAQAREAKGLAVAQVADKLKLTVRQVEALEAEDHARLPAPVFVRGFIRNYARLVDVPLDDLPAVTETSAEPTETITAHSEELRFNTSPVRKWVLLPLAVFGLFLILVVVLYSWLSQGEEAYVPEVPAITSLPLPLPTEPAADAAVPPAAPESSEAPAEPPAAQEPTVPVSSAPVLPTPAPAHAAVQPAPPAVLPPPVLPQPVNKAVRVVQIVAQDLDSWIEVVSGDDRQYNRLLHAGEQLTLRGAPPFRLVIGNAAGVRLSYDGRAIDLKPHIGDKVARLTLE